MISRNREETNGMRDSCSCVRADGRAWARSSGSMACFGQPCEQLRAQTGFSPAGRLLDG